MAEQKKVVLVYNYNKSWIAGAYYIEHIAKACMLLPKKQQPIISFLYNNDEGLERLKRINYPDATYTKMNFLLRLINKISFELFKFPILGGFYGKFKNQTIYPYLDSLGVNNSNRKIYWIPDFQEKYFPQLFSDVELKRRSNLYNHFAKNKVEIAFSSLNAAKDYNKFYPNQNSNVHILKFASLIPKYDHLAIQPLIQKFELNPNYFIVSNQFWKHKNHLLVLKAINELKSETLDFQIVFTGKYDSASVKGYYNELMNYSKEHGLERWIKILGFIARDEQLKLMKESIAIIQPSKFEGWSTVVEDAKALNKYILVSDIGLHREQIKKDCDFFPIDEPSVLASLIKKHLAKKPIGSTRSDYKEAVLKFAEDFVRLC